MINKKHREEIFFGSTTLGEKGQVVIPAGAREKMKLQKRDKLLVFSFGNDMLAFAKFDQLEKMARHLTERLENIRKIINKSK